MTESQHAEAAPPHSPDPAPASFDDQEALLAAIPSADLHERMGIEIIEARPERVVGRMPVEGNTQPYGLLHGGASCVLAEALGSYGAALHALPDRIAVGVDINARKVDQINRGEATILEEGIGELVEEQVDAGRLRATDDVGEAVATSELSMVSVGTPSRPNGSIDLSAVERVAEQIGEALRGRDDDHVFVLRSTVLPGTLEERVVPRLTKASGREPGEELAACVNPEFLREGTSIADFYDPPFTLIGAGDEAAADRVAALYSGIDAPVHRVPVRTAEMVKYACNAFHALKISFANEIGNVCKEMGIDSHRVMELVCADRKLNISPAYLKPGFAFGGSCLPKDVRALLYEARSRDVETPVLRGTLETNREQVERAARMVLETGRRSVGILGLSFKEGTDDLRESPMVALVEILLGKGLDLKIYDRDVRRSGLIGTNREFIESQVPHIWELMERDLSDVVESSEVLVVGNTSEEYANVEELRTEVQVIIDLARVLDDSAVQEASDASWYRGICW
jgi:GDP-mannose 6-dehydrogenase